MKQVAAKGNCMPTAHLYLFSDGCPDDWLVDGRDNRWHTIVYFAFQSTPSLQSKIETGAHFHTVLAQDHVFQNMFSKLLAPLPEQRLRKWKTSDAYKNRFIAAFSSAAPLVTPMINAYSYQERTLRASKDALLAAYNRHGITEKDLGFGESSDAKNRKVLRHTFMNFNGLHVITRLENQMLVLLLMAWAAADQFRFYAREIIGNADLGFDRLAMTVVSDKLSGDDDTKSESENNLRMLIDPYSDAPINLTRSPQSDQHVGDLLVDNMAGWLNSCMESPSGEHAQKFLDLSSRYSIQGWHEVMPGFTPLPAIDRIRAAMASSPSA